ncbi:MAG: ABC transporter permease [Armatimonadetes bacterium]|nr:ABC transporter permease [Armatimonadota bacterium]
MGFRAVLRGRLWRHHLAVAGLAITAVVVLVAVLAPWLATHDAYQHNRRAMLAAPGPTHWLGTDSFGRDVYSRILYGSRVSLSVGVLSMVLAMALGVIPGLVASFWGGWADVALSRAFDILMSFPAIIVAILSIAVIGGGNAAVVIALGIALAPRFARVVRGEVLSLRGRDFVEAARALGVPGGRIVFRHILPNVAGPLLILATVYLPHAILTEASLSFLGIGVQPDIASWGRMVAQGRTYLEVAPWISVFPGVAIMLTVVGFNLLGDGLRDVLDPRLRR